MYNNVNQEEVESEEGIEISRIGNMDKEITIEELKSHR